MWSAVSSTTASRVSTRRRWSATDGETCVAQPRPTLVRTRRLAPRGECRFSSPLTAPGRARDARPSPPPIDPARLAGGRRRGHVPQAQQRRQEGRRRQRARRPPDPVRDPADREAHRHAVAAHEGASARRRPRDRTERVQGAARVHERVSAGPQGGVSLRRGSRGGRGATGGASDGGAGHRVVVAR